MVLYRGKDIERPVKDRPISGLDDNGLRCSAVYCSGNQRGWSADISCLIDGGNRIRM